MAPESEPEPIVQEVEEVRAIAVPPRPEGVRKIQGEGDEIYRYTEQEDIVQVLIDPNANIAQAQAVQHLARRQPALAVGEHSHVAENGDEWQEQLPVTGNVPQHVGKVITFCTLAGLLGGPDHPLRGALPPKNGGHAGRG